MTSSSTTRRTLLLGSLAAGLAVAAKPAAATARAQSTSGVRTGYASINGLRTYYEIHGTGQPLILLHGGLGSTAMFADMIPALGRTRQVIAVDLQGHGRTADIDRPITYEAMADDIAALVRYLQIPQVDILGYSVGGGVALQTTIRHPAIMRKLVVVSATYKRSGWYPEILNAMAAMGPAMAEQMKASPLYKTYVSVAPRPDDWTALITKMSALLTPDYDWSKEVAAIRIPTLLVFGDADAVRPLHMVEFFALLGGGQRDAGWDGSGMPKSHLAILPGVTHYIMLESPPLPQFVVTFLDSPSK
jgi:pimeloyl-ACP methyl ester carboxylesterase